MAATTIARQARERMHVSPNTPSVRRMELGQNNKVGLGNLRKKCERRQLRSSETAAGRPEKSSTTFEPTHNDVFLFIAWLFVRLTFILCLQPPSGTNPCANRSHMPENPDTSTTITAASSSCSWSTDGRRRKHETGETPECQVYLPPTFVTPSQTSFPTATHVVV